MRRAATLPPPEVLERRVLLAATPLLVRDVHAGTESSDPRNLVEVDGTLFFTAN